jgi:hypothetical protein
MAKSHSLNPAAYGTSVHLSDHMAKSHSLNEFVPVLICFADIFSPQFLFMEPAEVDTLLNSMTPHISQLSPRRKIALIL